MFYIFHRCSGLTSVTIPNSVTSIADGVFSGCSGLNSITIPNSVTTIDHEAFEDCRSLTSLTIPNSVTNIGSEAFKDCYSLTYVIIGNGVTTIDGQAFRNCKNLTSVIIGSSVITINRNAFGNCDKLIDVYCYAEIVPTTDSETFNMTYIENATLHVPVASVENYQNAAPWNFFGSIVALNGDVKLEPIPKCEAPTISFVNGKLTFTCNTNGVEYISQITASDAKNYYDSSIVLTNKYTVSVYASKEGYENSDTVTKEITIGGNSVEGSGVFGDVNGDGVVNAADIVQIANIIMGK